MLEIILVSLTTIPAITIGNVRTIGINDVVFTSIFDAIVDTTSMSVELGRPRFWDSRSESLAAQALESIRSREEMCGDNFNVPDQVLAAPYTLVSLTSTGKRATKSQVRHLK